jgi:hypothetical protein
MKPYILSELPLYTEFSYAPDQPRSAIVASNIDCDITHLVIVEQFSGQLTAEDSNIIVYV